MTIFGIPLFISYDYILNFINTNLSFLTINDDTLLICFILVNFFYILLVIKVIRLIFFIIDFILNRIFRRYRRF